MFTLLLRNYPFMLRLPLLSLVMVALLFSGMQCASSGLNVFTVEQDLELGRQTAAEIRKQPNEFPILSESRNPQAYDYLQGLVDDIVRQGNVAHRDIFPYEVTIIDNDEVLNAFATPGGFLYVYTGLIKYLDSEDQLAGVMAHEIAHSALRHSTQQATRQYGIATLLSLVTGQSDPGLLSQIAVGLLSLKFSRSHEQEADSYSVIYLCPTSYNAAGAAGFFEKMQAQGSGAPPEFLSSHPSPANRVENIKQQARERNCTGRTTNQSRYEQFKRSL